MHYTIGDNWSLTKNIFFIFKFSNYVLDDLEGGNWCQLLRLKHNNRKLWIYEQQGRRVRDLSMRALVVCFHPHLHHAHVICCFRLKITSFMSFILVFLCAFREKNLCYNHNNALYGWYTRQRKHLHDSWWVASKELTFANLVSAETAFPQNFIVHQQLTTSFPPVLHVTDYYTCGQWASKQSRTRFYSRSRL